MAKPQIAVNAGKRQAEVRRLAHEECAQRDKAGLGEQTAPTVRRPGHTEQLAIQQGCGAPATIHFPLASLFSEGLQRGGH